MRIVIVGATTLGGAAARALVEGGHDVAVVDEDRDKLEALSDRVDCGFLHGDGTLPSVLKEAGGDSPDVLVCVTNQDEDNILSALVGRSIGFERVFPQILEREHRPICDQMELVDAIMPDETITASLVRAIESRSHVSVDRPLGGDLAVVRVTVAEEGAVDGLDLPEGARLVAISRGEEGFLPGEEDGLREGDLLVLAARPAAVDALTRRFGGEAFET